jgi:hypothetical protein
MVLSMTVSFQCLIDLKIDFYVQLSECSLENRFPRRIWIYVTAWRCWGSGFSQSGYYSCEVPEGFSQVAKLDVGRGACSQGLLVATCESLTLVLSKAIGSFWKDLL